MSEHTRVWNVGNVVPQGHWQMCPRYRIMASGCTRQFICKTEGIEACYRAFPKQLGTIIATHPKTIKQAMFSVKQHRFSVKMAGV